MPFVRRFIGSRLAVTTDTGGKLQTVVVDDVIGVNAVTSTTARLSLKSGSDLDVTATAVEVLNVIEPTPLPETPPIEPEPGDLTGGLLRVEPNGGGIAYQLAGENRLGDWALLQQNGPEIIVIYLWNEPGVPGIDQWPYLGVVQ